MLTQNDILCIIILLIVVYFIFRHNNNNNINNNTKYEKFSQPQAQVQPVLNFHQAKMNKKIKNLRACPVADADELNKRYLIDDLLNGTEKSSEPEPLPQQSVKKFHKDFFNFRDKTYHNSSEYYDSVDKVNDLYMQGYDGPAREYPGMKIKDIFDEITKNRVNLYDRCCVRLPYFDNINPQGYEMSYGTPALQLTGDEWRYPHEKIMNGGKISKGLYPNDKSYEKYLDYNLLGMYCPKQ